VRFTACQAVRRRGRSTGPIRPGQFRILVSHSYWERRLDKKFDKMSVDALSVRVTLAMDEAPTTVIIQRYLEALPGDTAAEPVVRDLLEQAAGRLRLLCATFLYKSYPRLTRPPVNLETDELLGGVVAGLLTALRTTRPRRCAGSSRWPTSTCAGSSMTWPPG
jgi:hypothetical protein